jgi:hypothetical protein
MVRILSMDDEVDFGERHDRRDRDDPSYKVLAVG